MTLNNVTEKMRAAGAVAEKLGLPLPAPNPAPDREALALPFRLVEAHDAGRGEGRGFHFKGLATAFGVLVDTLPLRTLIQPEAFDESLARDRDQVKVLWQHDPDEPIGKPVSLRRTGNGIEIEGVLSDTQRGRDAATLLRDGVVDRLSIGFDAVRTSITKMNGEEIRLLEKGKLWEVSLVTWGANSRARITDVNAAARRREDRCDQLLREAEAALHARGCVPRRRRA